MNGFHECELKFEVMSFDQMNLLMNTALKNGYKQSMVRIETDYIFDDKIFSFKKNKALFRLRDVLVKEKHTFLLTVKIKGSSSEFQDCTEFEFYLKHGDDNTISFIIDTVYKITKVRLDSYIFFLENAESFIKTIHNYGFHCRDIIQKKKSRVYWRYC